MPYADGRAGKRKSTYNDRDWIKEKGLKGLGQDAHIKKRSPNAEPGGTRRDAASLVNGKTVRGDGKGRPFFRPNGELPEKTQRALGGYMAGGAVVNRADGQTGTSIFDPVLCELAYRWFCPPAGLILDPFSGGSVRGIVASVLGYSYTGVDLSKAQIAANKAQAKEITPNNPPRWIVGDSRDMVKLAKGQYDLIFSCPPYFDLEVYSEDARDLSTMEWTQFLESYRLIISQCIAMLKDNRFACFVVGDMRDKKGFYRNFTGETVNAFVAAGMNLYNEAVLVTAFGSLPIRIGRQFGAYRKLGKTHQNVLVFYKGDPKKIPADFGEIDVPDLSELFGEVS